ncbi:hypothetical protein [Paraburkholderia silvatlantica]|uniref:hypothetical protein n=1 Tax=Paraburkholderia silvatlantica TaxID=321895 RepID=UPI003752A7B4
MSAHVVDERQASLSTSPVAANEPAAAPGAASSETLAAELVSPGLAPDDEPPPPPPQPASAPAANDALAVRLAELESRYLAETMPPATARKKPRP